MVYFYRNPPPDSGVKPQPYSAIAKLIHRPHAKPNTLRWAAVTFMAKKSPRGRKPGWRKTTSAEDKAIFNAFFKVRQPLGILVEARDVWKALRGELRDKVSIRTVANRLREKGFKMEEKLSGEDKGEAWRMRRVRFCRSSQETTAPPKEPKPLFENPHVRGQRSFATSTGGVLPKRQLRGGDGGWHANRNWSLYA